MDKFDDQINMFENANATKRTKKHSLDAKAKKIIDEMQFNKDKSLDDNLAELDEIVKQLATDLSTYRASGIGSIKESEANNNVWFDLQGRRIYKIDAQSKKIHVVKGKKVVVK